MPTPCSTVIRIRAMAPLSGTTCPLRNCSGLITLRSQDIWLYRPAVSGVTHTHNIHSSPSPLSVLLPQVPLLHTPRADPTVCSDLGELRETALQPWCTQASRLSPAGTACLPTPIASSLGAERAQFLVQNEISTQFPGKKKHSEICT